MKRMLLALTTGLCCLLAAGATTALAEGFGTPTVDGVLDGVYGAAEAMDPDDDPQGNAPMDLLDLYVVNDNSYWYFYFTVDDDLDATQWGKYILYIDTTGDGNGATFDAWGRNVLVNDPHKPEFSINSWIDGGGVYDTGKVQFWSWDGAAWSNVGTIADAALQAGTPSAIEWKVPKAALGSPSSIWCEVWSTSGGETDNAQDTINDPADDWNATDWFTQALLYNSTRVDEATGGDTEPPTVILAKAIGQDPITQIEVTFSEPVDQTTAEDAGNYAVSDGIAVTLATLQGDPAKVMLDLDSALGFGICYSVTVTDVEDEAGNVIVDNGTTNVDCFKLFDLFWRAHMNLRLRDVTHFPDPDTFAIEGSMDPLTWNPTCDDLLSDVDGDSVYTGRFQFCLSCACEADTIETVALEYKFTHQCTDWEGIGNHYYAFDDAVPSDTLDIWWEDVAPQDLIEHPIDVIWRVNMNQLENPPTDGVDTVGVAGSELPLTWVLPAVDNQLRDDGEPPDQIAGDGIWYARTTFPTGTQNTVEYKFAINRVYECEGQGNREVFLDDTIYSEGNPYHLPMQYYDLCIPLTAVDPPAALSRLRVSIQPNPTSMGAQIRFIAPEAGSGRVSVYDAGGRLIRRLEGREYPAGNHAITFDGKDQVGRPLPQGIYFIRVDLDGVTEVRSMTLIR